MILAHRNKLQYSSNSMYRRFMPYKNPDLGRQFILLFTFMGVDRNESKSRARYF